MSERRERPHGEEDRRGSENNLSGVLAYMAEKYTTLRNDYRTPDGNYAESCGLIAADIARMLVTAGKKPVLMDVRGPEIREHGLIGNGPVIPKIYEGRVRWGGHTVCVCESIVYDPMVGEPKSLAEYTNDTFIEPVELRVHISEDEMEEFLGR